MPQAKRLIRYILNNFNMVLNAREIFTEKVFDVSAIMAPGLWEDDHFVIRVCNGVLVHNMALIKA